MQNEKDVFSLCLGLGYEGLCRSELHLPPARVACPDGLFFLEGKGFGWYRKESQRDIVQSRDYLLKLVQRLGVKRPVIFAGFSQGAVMSIISCGSHPRSAQALRYPFCNDGSVRAGEWSSHARPDFGQNV
jgi:predicted esterase